MRFLLGLILVPAMACLVVALCLALGWVMNPQGFAVFWITPLGLEAVRLGFMVFCAYAAPTALVLLPLVDRWKPLTLRGSAILSAVGGIATVLLSLPFKPEFLGFALTGKRPIAAMLLAAIGGVLAGLIFVSIRRRFSRG